MNLRTDEFQGFHEVSIRRDLLLQDSFATLNKLTPEQWRRKFKIVFKNEAGMDAGGLSKDWYANCFDGCANAFVVERLSCDSYHLTVGVIALAFRYLQLSKAACVDSNGLFQQGLCFSDNTRYLRFKFVSSVWLTPGPAGLLLPASAHPSHLRSQCRRLEVFGLFMAKAIRDRQVRSMV